MNISFDLDGVLYPFTKVCYDYLQIHHGIKEDYDTFWKKTWRSYSELHRENIVGIRSLYEKVPINPTVKSRLDYLATYNQIFYITSRSKDLKFVTEKWIKRYSLPYPENVVFNGSKLPAVIENNIDVHVDDQLKYLEELEGYCERILIAHPWNEAGQGILRTYNTVLEYLDELCVETYNYDRSDFLYDSYRERGLL